MPGVRLLTAALLALAAPSWAVDFDVASIRASKENRGSTIVRTPGGLTAINNELGYLLEMAFQTRQIDLSAVAGALLSQRFDVIAKAEGKITADQHWEMLQALLTSRFKLKYHREMKDAQIYAMILGKNGERLGPKISRSEDRECPAEPTDLNFCGVRLGLGQMRGQRSPMARIAKELSAVAGRPVQDQTGLAGRFDFELKWTPDPLLLGDAPKKLNGVEIDTSAPDLLAAIQQQLGLKLDPRKGQIEILVIDHAEQPSEN